ncbi:MAG TPA: head GIN domain-containing protein [Flavobacterium sp.]|jgi:hypothetical protein|nr:head GIN domain-containing protein [Flavobacterium sp.]HPJ10865.1 head GIN domain-containing protein [Flavobacterium sp.]
MKNVLNTVLLVILTAPLCHGQIKKNVGEFTKIKTFDRITVTLVPSNEERVEFNGSRSTDAEVINKNGELKIRMRTGKLLDGESIDAKVYFRQLTDIDANEGSFIGCDKPFKQEFIYASAQEGAEVKITADTQQTRIRAATGGKIKVSGTTKDLDVKLGAGGILEAKNLKSVASAVDVKAGGEAQVRASESVDAHVTAGGKILIYGNPKRVERKTTLGGKIEEIRE